MNNGGCDHTCTNNYGRFKCSCDEGYELDEDEFQCKGKMCFSACNVLHAVQFLFTALKCPLLEPPRNGSIYCDRQTVTGTCNFNCTSSYSLRGSMQRSCLSSLLWTGRPAICDPPLCPDLSPPDNGFIVFPCSREEKTACSILCFPGYTLAGPSRQTCIMSSTEKQLVWTEPPICEGIGSVQLYMYHFHFQSYRETTPM